MSEILFNPAIIGKWQALSREEKTHYFESLNTASKKEFFINLPPNSQKEILEDISPKNILSWIDLLPPDDLVDLLQEFEEEEHPHLLNHISSKKLKEVKVLLVYAEDNAGGLMNSQFARLRMDMDVESALDYLRIQSRKENIETIYHAYVLAKGKKLMGVISLRELISASDKTMVSDIMNKDVIKANTEMDQEELSHLFQNNDLITMPIVDKDNVMKGIVTVDDIIDVVEEEATEDIQKIGGSEELNAPYFEVGLWEMLKKRGGWLIILFISEMFTAQAMAHYEDQLAQAVVLAFFIPLIISSGGNTGSQSSTLIIRALALSEIRLKDWWRVFAKELFTGLFLGLLLGGIGFLRVSLWPGSETIYGEHYMYIALTVALSLVGIVVLGTITGSMLPFILKMVKLDPATASAPFVATLVDVTGLIIYFSLASLILSGLLF